MNAQESATLAKYLECVHAFKKANKTSCTNVAMLPEEMERGFFGKPCRLWTRSDCVFLTVLNHNLFQSLYFHCIADSMTRNLRLFLEETSSPLPVVCHVFGRKPEMEKYDSTFSTAGFTLARYLRKFDSTKRKMRRYAEHNRAEFATSGDVEEILSIFFEKFDPYTDHVPDREELVRQILEKKVIVIRYDNRIIAVNSFAVRGARMLGLFGYVDEAYRNSVVFWELSGCIRRLSLELGIVKHISWHDETNTRLIDGLTRFGEIPEDMYAHVFVHKEDACAKSHS